MTVPAEPASGSDSVAVSLDELISARLSRRAALRGLATAASSAALGAGVVGAGIVGEGVATADEREERIDPKTSPSSLTFKEIEHVYTKDLHVPPGYEAQVLIRWGDPLAVDAPAFDPAHLTAAAQEKQFGYNNDFLAFMPLPYGSKNSERGLLCSNHEYTDSELMFSGITRLNKHQKMTQEQVDVEMSAHGHSVVEIRRVNGGWEVVRDSRYNRRFTMATTPMRISGPAAGHRRLRTSADPTGSLVIGTLNNCAGGVTPWGTVLTGEENFQYYFGGKASKTTEARNHAKYDVGEPEKADAKTRLQWEKSTYTWSRFHDRFHLQKEPHEPNRFGWIVEIDPYDAESTPIKRTARGRMRHEGAATSISHDGRVVVYTGDDTRFQYLYKFVSNKPYNPKNRAANRDLLDHGTLYVARFSDEGRVYWLPLVYGSGPLTPVNGFASQADVLIETRRAADLLKATPMDRPEDVEENPATGKVYVVLTSNSRRTAKQVDAANPRPRNLHGHVIELTLPRVNGKPDHAARTCDWDLFLLAGDPGNPEHRAKYHPDTSTEGWLSCPDNCAFDPQGRIWLATDGAPREAKVADGIYACDTEGPGRALTKLFFQAPLGAEVCGPCFTPDGKTLFLAIEHPGEDDDDEPKKGETPSTFDHPSTRWPDFQDDMPPRPAVVAITKKDGGPIGT